jgi:hypothetical protein
LHFVHNYLWEDPAVDGGGIVKGQRFAGRMLLLVISLLIIAPGASARGENMDIPLSTGPLDKDNPQLISVLKMHTAYVGVTQQARMNGVIGYIDSISDGAGSTNLRWIQDDYLTAASSIPLLYTADEITAAREEMRTQSIRFFDEINIQMAAFNGTAADMKASTDEAVADAETTFAHMPGSVWLIKGSARIAAFNTSAEKRANLLLTLTRNGVDITEIRKLSDQIDAMRTELQAVVVKNQEGAILSLNSGIARLNSQFRGTVDEALDNRKIQLKAATILSMK